MVTSRPIINILLECNMGPKISPLVTKLSNCKSGILLGNNNSEPSPDHTIDHQPLHLSYSISLERKPSAVLLDGWKMLKTTATKMLFLFLQVIKLIFLNKEWLLEIRLSNLPETMKCYTWKLRLKINKMQKEHLFGRLLIYWIKQKVGLYK